MKIHLTGQAGFSGLFWPSFSAESGMAISRFRLETEKAIDPINPVYPACPVGPQDRTGVQNKNYT